MSLDYAKRVRVVLAFLISPLVPAVLGGAMVAFARGDPGIIFSTGTLWAVKIAIAFGYPVVFAIGIPLYIALRNDKLTGVWIFVLIGGGCGVAMYLLFIVLPLMAEGAAAMMRRVAETISLVGLTFFIGALSGLSFWLVARPDRMC